MSLIYHWKRGYRYYVDTDVNCSHYSRIMSAYLSENRGLQGFQSSPGLSSTRVGWVDLYVGVYLISNLNNLTHTCCGYVLSIWKFNVVSFYSLMLVISAVTVSDQRRPGITLLNLNFALQYPSSSHHKKLASGLTHFACQL